MRPGASVARLKVSRTETHCEAAFAGNLARLASELRFKWFVESPGVTDGCAAIVPPPPALPGTLPPPGYLTRHLLGAVHPSLRLTFSSSGPASLCSRCNTSAATRILVNRCRPAQVDTHARSVSSNHQLGTSQHCVQVVQRIRSAHESNAMMTQWWQRVRTPHNQRPHAVPAGALTTKAQALLPPRLLLP